MSRIPRTALVWKPLGKTPLETAEAFRRGEIKELKSWAQKVFEKIVWLSEATQGLFRKELFGPSEVSSTPIAYAGRLDPMAEGVLLLLIGNECKKIAQYRDLDKVYEVEVLLGASTDSGDLLGLVREIDMMVAEKIYVSEPKKFATSFSYVSLYCAPKFLQHIFSLPLYLKALNTVFRKFVGTHTWPYPVFSSKTVQGKPLFRWFYEGKINEIEIPKRQVTMYSVQTIDSRTISATELLHEIKTRIAKVTKVDDASKEWGNDFRREEVLRKWNGALVPEVRSKKKEENNNDDAIFCADFSILKIRVACSSGTYMRTLAEKIGDELGVPACAFSITRTKIGTHYPLIGVVSV